MQEDFEEFGRPEDIYEALDLDNIAELPSVQVPHAVGAAQPRDKEKEREKERVAAAAAAIKTQLGVTRYAVICMRAVRFYSPKIWSSAQVVFCASQGVACVQLQN